MILVPITLNSNEEIVLFNDLKIRKITLVEYEKYFGIGNIKFENNLVVSYSNICNPDNTSRLDDDYFPPQYIHWNNFHNLNFVGKLLMKHSIPRFLIEHNDYIQIKNLLFILRLLSDVNFLAPIGYNNERMQTHFFDFSFSEKHILNLSTIDIAKVDKLLNKLYNSKDVKIDLLKHRFSLISNVDLDKKLRFVEAVSIIESIVCGNEKNELRFRFSLFSHFLIDYADFNEFKKIYDIRSQLVHTGRSKLFSNQLLERIVRISKDILLEYIQNDVDGDEILRIILNKK